MLTWSGDLQELPGKSGQKGYLYPRTLAFSLAPAAGSEPNVALALNRTIEAYHQQTSGTRFQVLTSKWGYALDHQNLARYLPRFQL